jgi:hypothetical protein
MLYGMGPLGAALRSTQILLLGFLKTRLTFHSVCVLSLLTCFGSRGWCCLGPNFTFPRSSLIPSVCLAQLRVYGSTSPCLTGTTDLTEFYFQTKYVFKGFYTKEMSKRKSKNALLLSPTSLESNRQPWRASKTPAGHETLVRPAGVWKSPTECVLYTQE